MRPDRLLGTDISTAIREKNLDEVFFALGFLYKKQPDYRTAHNFGTFLSKYGQETSFFSQKMFRMAEELLAEAEGQKESFITSKERGDLYWRLKRYKPAAAAYRRAWKRQKTYSLCYNLAITYFCLRDYVSMAAHLEAALRGEAFPDGGDEGAASLKELLAAAYALSGRKAQARRLLRELQQDGRYENTPQTLRLAYLCEDFSFILDHYEAIFRGWMYEGTSYAIVCRAFRRLNRPGLAAFKAAFRRDVAAFYADNPDLDSKEREALSAQIDEIDGGTIPEIALVWAPVFSCDFY